MDSALDIAIMVGIIWMLVSFWLNRPKSTDRRHVWGELDSAQVARALAKRRD